MAFSKVGDSQILKIMSVENGKTKNIKKGAACPKCGKDSCVCGSKFKITDHKKNECSK